MKKTSFIIIGLLLLTIIFMGYKQYNLNNKLQISEQNYIAAIDSMNIIELKNQEMLYEKEIYILKETELNARLDITNEELKEIKKKLKSSIDYISRIDGEVKIDTIHTIDTLYYRQDSIPILSFSYKDEWLNLNGETKFNKSFNNPETTINNIEVPLTLQTGLTRDNNIFIKTNNPYVNITSIEGAIINDKKFKINFKHNLLIGAGFQYGLFNNKIDFGPQIGYGISIEF